MSGGHFNYNQYIINDISDEIQDIINNNNIPDEYNCCSNYSEKTIEALTTTIAILKVAQAMTHRIDWLISGDDSEETFHVRLKEDMDKLANS